MAHEWDQPAVREIQRYAILAQSGGYDALEGMTLSAVDGQGGKRTGNSMIAMTKPDGMSNSAYCDQLNAMTERQYADQLDVKMRQDPEFRNAVLNGLENNPEMQASFLRDQGVSSLNEYRAQVGAAEATRPEVRPETGTGTRPETRPGTVGGGTEVVAPETSGGPDNEGGNSANATIQPTGLAYQQALMAATDDNFSSDNITGAINPETVRKFDNRMPSDVTAELEKEAAEQQNANSFATLLSNAQSAESGVLVAMLQAVLRALGFNISVDGQMSEDVEAAATDAQTLLESRDAIIAEVEAAGNDDLSVDTSGAGLVIRVGDEEAVISRDAIIAADGSLEALIDEVPNMNADVQSALDMIVSGADAGAGASTGATNNGNNDATNYASNGSSMFTADPDFQATSYQFLPVSGGYGVFGLAIGETPQLMVALNDAMLADPASHGEALNEFFDIAARDDGVLTSAIANITRSLHSDAAALEAIKNAYTGGNADVIAALGGSSNTAAPANSAANSGSGGAASGQSSSNSVQNSSTTSSNGTASITNTFEGVNGQALMFKIDIAQGSIELLQGDGAPAEQSRPGGSGRNASKASVVGDFEAAVNDTAAVERMREGMMAAVKSALNISQGGAYVQADFDKLYDMSNGYGLLDSQDDISEFLREALDTIQDGPYAGVGSRTEANGIQSTTDLFDVVVSIDNVHGAIVQPYSDITTHRSSISAYRLAAENDPNTVKAMLEKGLEGKFDGMDPVMLNLFKTSYDEMLARSSGSLEPYRKLEIEVLAQAINNALGSAPNGQQAPQANTAAAPSS